MKTEEEEEAFSCLADFIRAEDENASWNYSWYFHKNQVEKKVCKNYIIGISRFHSVSHMNKYIPKTILVGGN